MCNLTTSLLGDVCGDVQIEPTLVPLSGEAQFCRSANVSQGKARCQCLWFLGRSIQSDDVRRPHFSPQCPPPPPPPSVRMVPVASQYVKHEKAKRHQYEQRVRDVEGTSFVPLVLSMSGGMDRSAAVTFKRLSVMLAEKPGLSYAATVNVIRCRLSFALLCSAITAPHGSRRRLPYANLQLALAFAEARLVY